MPACRRRISDDMLWLGERKKRWRGAACASEALQASTTRASSRARVVDGMPHMMMEDGGDTVNAMRYSS